MRTAPITEPQLARANTLVESLGQELRGFVEEVETGPFAQGALDGTLPIEALRFFVEQTYQLILNDMANLSIYVAKARDESELEFFSIMTNAEKLMLDSLYLLVDGIGIGRDALATSQPELRTAYRTNHFTRLALYHLPGDIALSILLNFPVWAGGARRVSQGMKDHYGLGKVVEGTELLDTDVLDRFSQSTQHFLDMAVAIVATDLTSNEAEARMRTMGRLAVEYEAMVWRSYYNVGLESAEA